MSLTGKPSLTTAEPITNDGFWADVDMADLMDKYRMPSEYPDSTIKWGLTLAILRVNDKLIAVKYAIVESGFSSFKLYIDNLVDPVVKPEWLEMQYEHAVYSRAKAFLLQQFKTVNRRVVAENEAKESEETEKYWLDESAKSIAALNNLIFPLENHVANDNVHVASL